MRENYDAAKGYKYEICRMCSDEVISFLSLWKAASDDDDYIESFHISSNLHS